MTEWQCVADTNHLHQRAVAERLFKISRLTAVVDTGKHPPNFETVSNKTCGPVS